MRESKLLDKAVALDQRPWWRGNYKDLHVSRFIGGLKEGVHAAKSGQLGSRIKPALKFCFECALEAPKVLTLPGKDQTSVGAVLLGLLFTPVVFLAGAGLDVVAMSLAVGWHSALAVGQVPCFLAIQAGRGIRHLVRKLRTSLTGRRAGQGGAGGSGAGRRERTRAKCPPAVAVNAVSPCPARADGERGGCSAQALPLLLLPAEQDRKRKCTLGRGSAH